MKCPIPNVSNIRITLDEKSDYGLIKKIFPLAKIINCTRNPKSSLISNPIIGPPS